VPFARDLATNQITYADIRVLESETAVTETGSIAVVYARHGGIGNLGFSSSIPHDRIVVVLMDSVRRLVIQDIIPSVSSGYIPPRLIANERHAADKAARVELRSMVYLPMLQKEFGGHVSHPEHIVDALRPFCREHELDHKIRAIVGLDSHDENKADLRPMSTGILPFKESGILSVERERLIEIAKTVYEGLDNPRRAIERNKAERYGGSATVWGVRSSWLP